MWALILLPVVAAYSCGDLTLVVDGCAASYNATAADVPPAYDRLLRPWWTGSEVRFFRVADSEGCARGTVAVPVERTWDQLIESRLTKMHRILNNTTPSAVVRREIETFWGRCECAVRCVIGA